MDNQAANTDKWLHYDGSVTTLSGELLLPADESRAADFASRAAQADKWLHPDGSVVDSSGNVILPPDESRAQDYESRMPGVGGVFPGAGLHDDFAEVIPDFADSGFVFLQPFIRETEDVITAFPAVCLDDASLVFFPWIQTAEIVTEQYNISDAATAVLS